MIWSGWSPFSVTGRNARTSTLAAVGSDRDPQELHLGDVLHLMKEAAGENVGEVDGDQPGVRLQEGFIFEQAVEYMLGGMGFDEAVELAFKRYLRELRGPEGRQARYVADGIHMTPDMVLPGLLESYKVTRRSLRRARTAEDFAENFWVWMLQEKCYARAAGVDTVRWVVWWVAGDYSRGMGTGPLVLESTAVFEPKELDEAWDVVRGVADRIRGTELRRGMEDGRGEREKPSVVETGEL